MNKTAISIAIGFTAGLALAAAYIGAPYAGFTFAPAQVMVAAAVILFGSAVALLTMSALAKPEKKKPRSSKRLSDLGVDDYSHFPTTGLRIVLRPDSVIEELDVVRNPSSYTDKSVFLIIKKSSGKSVFNPVILKRLFERLSGFANFAHVLLVNEHDEYVGYIPAGYVRRELLSAEDTESLIVKYIVNVLASPRGSDVLRQISGQISGLSVDECISDNETVSTALKKVTEGLFRGLVVFKDTRNRKPIGVIWSEDLIKLVIPDKD